MIRISACQGRVGKMACPWHVEIKMEDPMKKQIVFDVDDVMWGLNQRVSELTGIPYEKFTVYHIPQNPNLTDAEKELVLSAYHDSKTFQNIVFSDTIISLINQIHHEYMNYEVKIVSNCLTAEIMREKKSQLLNVLDLPEHSLRFNIINNAKKKTLPEHIFLLADDSPHNILQAEAVHKIMPAKPYNDNLIKQGSAIIDRPETDEELTRLVMNYIR